MRGERGERETYLVCGVSVPHNQFSVLRSTDKVPRMQSQREREREREITTHTFTPYLYFSLHYS